MNHKRNPMDCPHCGKFNDLHSCVSEPGAAPSEGDFTMCIECGKWSVFSSNGFRLPMMEEWGIIMKDPDCRKTERAWKRMREQMGMD